MNVTREIQYQGPPQLLAQLVSDLEAAGCKVTAPEGPIIYATGTRDAIQAGVDAFQARGHSAAQVLVNDPRYSRGVAAGQPNVVHAVEQPGQANVSLCSGEPVELVPGVGFSPSYSRNCAECEAEVKRR